MLGDSRRLASIRRSISGRNFARVFNRLLASLRCQTSGLFDFELGDHLRLAFVEDLKIVLAKIPDGVALGVADDGAHHYQLYVHFECGGFVVRSEFGRVLFGLGRRSGVGGRSLVRTILGECMRWGEIKTRKER